MTIIPPAPQRSATWTEPVCTSTLPGLGILPVEAPTDLETRVAVRKRELIAELIGHKQSMSIGAEEAGNRIKTRLSELAHIVRQVARDGWTNVSDAATSELEQWISR
jgi:hypothetical protein